MPQEGLRTIWSFVLDCVFPQSCLGCEKEDVFMCGDCRALITSQGILQEPGGNITKTYSLTAYQPDSVSGKLIESLKYHFSTDASEEVTEWIKKSEKIFSTISVDLVIPIPLHPRRLAERGFNQAAIIARPVALRLNKPLAKTVLSRVKFTKQQALLGKAERIKNTADAFAVAKSNVIKGKTCLLVDDVYTTGSTMQSAAKALREAGADIVIGFTLARAE